ncbi:PKD domain-containing protein [bacterium]|nr:MAG: PKD domain-containing protein [bacterium]
MIKPTNIKTILAAALFAVYFSSCNLYNGISQQLKVEKISINTRNYDELSPVFYRKGIVFCSNRRGNSLAGYTNKDIGLFKIFYSEPNSISGWKSPVLFSDEITTTFNEGPATFNNQGTIMYFTRNNYAGNSLSNVADSSNKLGIFSAELINGKWQNINEFAYNDPLFVFATPSISADGMRLFFTSDKPGGFGGMDLYYCEKSGTGWQEPVNMGPLINTSGNEAYPFADVSGKIYFASDGHPGMGGKDIYHTFENEGQWISPVHADSLINTRFDDFGIVLDSTGLKGYFSSNRLLSDDIYRFDHVMPEFSGCDTFAEPVYCFTFYDERYIPNDTLILHYSWNFGNGIIRHGPQVGHCFPGPGKYLVKLDITDEISGDTIAWQVEYNVVLELPDQLFINSANIGLIGKEIFFDTEGSMIQQKGITDYSWDFGDGFISGISSAHYKFNHPGRYVVKAAMKVTEPDVRECVQKELRIVESIISLLDTVVGSTELRILAANDLSISQLASIRAICERNKLNAQMEPNFYTEKAVTCLINDPELHLEILINHDNAIQDQMKKVSRELSFYLKSHGANMDSYGVSVVKASQLLAGTPGKSTKTITELIFTSK